MVTWSGLTLAGRIGEPCHRLLYLAIEFGLISITLDNTRLSLLAVLKHPDVQKVLYGGPFLLKQECSSSDGQKGPTAEDSPPPVKEEEEPVSPETKKSSDASVHRDESDKTSTKDG